jgi:hypothetical protein
MSVFASLRVGVAAALLLGASGAGLATFAACASNDPQSRAFEVAETPKVPADPPASDFKGDATTPDAAEAGFATCASAAVEAKREQLPVDIIWIVDNSASMAPAVAEVQAGLNTFAGLVGSKGLDYKVVMLSLRGSGPLSVGGKTRHPVCIPPPLGAADCGNTPLFFHAPVDIQSTQPLEQILGTLDQTQGYTAGTARGSEPWAQELRANASKSIVLVTDDNSRFPGVSFEGFPGGDSPYTGGLVLPPGILHPSRSGAWKDYLFSAIYGWGTTVDPSIRCSFPDGSKPAASGSEYTALVQKTGGVRAQICDGNAAWGPFFNAVATAVSATARVACELDIPRPDAGTVDPSLVNVRVTDGTKPASTVPRVAAEPSCAGLDGWYYDVPAAPAKVILCPKSCEGTQSHGGTKLPKVEVLFGCETVVR